MSVKYRTIVADPPWHYEFGARTHSDKGWDQLDGELIAPLPYNTMSVEDIAALPVRDFADKRAHLYLWTTNAYLEDAYEIARLWGFRPSTLLTWCKTPNGIGLGGTYSLTTEFVLFARRGVCKAAERVDTTWWHWKIAGERVSAASALYVPSRKRQEELAALPYHDAAEHKCRRCRRLESEMVLHVHHLTYERRGYEDPRDLEVLCRDCHRAEHGITE